MMKELTFTSPIKTPLFLISNKLHIITRHHEEEITPLD